MLTSKKVFYVKTKPTELARITYNLLKIIHSPLWKKVKNIVDILMAKLMPPEEFIMRIQMEIF